MGSDDLLIMQPTGVVARKGNEHSVELARRLTRRRARLVITHAAGDEGDTYGNFLRLFSGLMQVPLLLADRWVAEQRGRDADGRRQYTLQDVYQQTDLVAYPSEYEGFGNAFLEAVYCRRPILCKRYPIFRTDIEPYGFRTLAFDDYITEPLIRQVEEVLTDPDCQREMVEHNYRVAQQYFSYEVLEEELRPILRRVFVPNRCGGVGTAPYSPRCSAARYPSHMDFRLPKTPPVPRSVVLLAPKLQLPEMVREAGPRTGPAE